MQASNPVPEPTPQLPQQRQVKDQDRAVNHLRKSGSKTASKLIPETPSQPEIIIAPALSTIRESLGGLVREAALRSRPDPRPDPGNAPGPPEGARPFPAGGGKIFDQSTTETAYAIKIQSQPGVHPGLTKDDIDLSSMARSAAAARALSTGRPQAVEVVDGRRLVNKNGSTRSQLTDSKKVIDKEGSSLARSSAAMPASSKSEGPILSRNPVENAEPPRVPFPAQPPRNQQPLLPVPGRSTPPASHPAPRSRSCCHSTAGQHAGGNRGGSGVYRAVVRVRCPRRG